MTEATTRDGAGDDGLTNNYHNRNGKNKKLKN